jgi:hypothetical protein
VIWVELVFMMLVLKIPLIYVCAVVWYAVRAVPDPLEGAALPADIEPDGPRGWWSRHRRGGPRPPHGSPRRRYARVARPAGARAEARR